MDNEKLCYLKFPYITHCTEHCIMDDYETCQHGAMYSMHNNQQFSTGAQRAVEVGRGRPELIPPRALLAWSRTCEEGAAKYGDRNWEKGIPMSNLLGHALTHLIMFQIGDTSEDHLGHAMWNVGAMIEELEKISEGLLPESLDDIPRPTLRILK